MVIRYPKGTEPKLADLERLHRPQAYYYCPCHPGQCAPLLMVTYGRITAAMLEAQGMLAMRGLEADCLSLLRIPAAAGGNLAAARPVSAYFLF